MVSILIETVAPEAKKSTNDINFIIRASAQQSIFIILKFPDGATSLASASQSTKRRQEAHITDLRKLAFLITVQ